MLISLDAIADFLASSSNGDVFTVRRLKDGQWDVVVTAYSRRPAYSDHTVIDLTASDDDADADAEEARVEASGSDAVASVSSSASAEPASSAGSAVPEADDSDSDDDSVDYGLSQDFLYMAEIMDK